ncbi:MAG: hypothetical protein HYT37_01675 [Candidatus Sungbacteria bacterium]|nr:hypothetical protein [Candidatus Sungbacteria bacterium]
MLIPHQLPQFTDEIVLIIVAAKQEGSVYRASDGQLELIETFRIPTPHFSDNEGMPHERGKQESAAEKKIHKEYMDHFEKLFRTISVQLKPTQLYFFAPSHIAEELKRFTQTIFRPIPAKDIAGIFTRHSPLEVLELIKQSR